MVRFGGVCGLRDLAAIFVAGLADFTDFVGRGFFVLVGAEDAAAPGSISNPNSAPTSSAAMVRPATGPLASVANPAPAFASRSVAAT